MFPGGVRSDPQAGRSCPAPRRVASFGGSPAARASWNVAVPVTAVLGTSSGGPGIRPSPKAPPGPDCQPSGATPRPDGTADIRAAPSLRQSSLIAPIAPSTSLPVPPTRD